MKKGILLLIVLAVSLMLTENAQSGCLCSDCSCDTAVFFTREYPDDDWDWSEEVQGVAHDVAHKGYPNHWYITSKEYIWQVAEGFDLNQDFGDCNDVEDADYLQCVGLPGDMTACLSIFS